MPVCPTFSVVRARHNQNTANNDNSEQRQTTIELPIGDDSPGRSNAPVSSFIETGDHESQHYEGDILNMTRRLTLNSAESQEKFLERAYIVEQLELTSTSHGLVGRFVFPQDYLKIPFIAPKVAYYKYLRAKGIKFIITTNATAYHYGKLFVRWLPVVGVENLFGGELLSKRLDQYVTAQAVYPAEGVDIELKGSNQHEFTVGYKLNNQFMRLGNLANNTENPVMGTLQLNVINPPLTIPDPRPVYVTIYAALVEPSLSVPSATAATFGNMITATASIPELFDSSLSTTTAPVYQMDEAEAKSKEGVISGKLEKLAEVSNLLTPVPGVVGRAASVISTAASTGANIAKTLGYGKTTDVKIDEPMFVRVPSVSTGRGLLPTYKITTDPENSKPFLGKAAMQDASQMLIPNIVKKESYLGTSIIPATTQVGARLMTIKLKPWLKRQAVVTMNGVETNVFGHTLQSYVGACFKHYRGGMRVRIEIIMSSFQSMRLWILYSPPGEDLPSSYHEMQSLQKRVVTVNGTHSEEVVIPYINAEYVISKDTTNVTNQDIGSISVVAASILTSSADSSQPIYMNVYFNCTDDAEFFIPRAAEELTSNYSDPVYQSGVEDTTLMEFKSNAVGPALTGERIDSIKTLMQKGIMLAYEANDPATTTVQQLAYVMNPASELLLGNNNVLEYKLTATTDTPMPWFMYFARMFRFRTGGFLVTLIPTDGNDDSSLAIIDYSANYYRGTLVSDFIPQIAWKGKQVYSMQGFQIVPANKLMPASFKVPYYGTRPFVANNCLLRADIYILNRPAAPSMVTRIEPARGAATFLSVADDFELMDLLGAPTLYTQ